MKNLTNWLLVLGICAVITMSVVWVAGDAVRCQTWECLANE